MYSGSGGFSQTRNFDGAAFTPEKSRTEKFNYQRARLNSLVPITITCRRIIFVTKERAVGRGGGEGV